MTLFQFILAYAISWSLTLFVVLPWGVKVVEHPQPGHAPSAPENPQLKRKLLITSVLALIPVALFWLFTASPAFAESGLYHAGSGSSSSGDTECADYQTPEGVDVGTNDAVPTNIRSGISVPTADYISDQDLKDKLYTSETYIGAVDVDAKGNTRLNGKLIGNRKCPPK